MADRGLHDRLISGLGKRALLHNVHAKGPQVFQTRWAMNYLAGPLTRTQIRLSTGWPVRSQREHRRNRPPTLSSSSHCPQPPGTPAFPG